MNLFLLIGISLVVLYLLLNFFAKASSKKIAKGIRYIIFTVGILLAIALFIVGRYAFSIPILIFLLPLLKLKGIGGIFQLIQLWRLISYLRQTGRYSFRSGTNYSKASSNISVDGSDDSIGGVFSQDALGLAMMQDLKIESQRDASLRADEIVATAVYGVGELHDSYGIEMLNESVIN